MFSIPRQVKIFVALGPTDMRRGFDGLSGMVQQTLQQDPLSGHLFLFRNRRRDRLKILFWDGDGYALDRIVDAMYGNDVVSWQYSSPSPGQ